MTFGGHCLWACRNQNRHDDAYSYVSAWGYTGNLAEPKLQKEWLKYQSVDFVTRSYK